MCTAITFQSSDFYFGRNLDLEYSYNENVIITPRNYPIRYKRVSAQTTHYGIIGAGIIRNNYPLYYDATNEYGLSIAGLNFPGNAVYYDCRDNKDNIASFELIPWILCQCKSCSDAQYMLKNINITNDSFQKEYPTSPLHWIIADANSSLTVEQTQVGLNLYQNEIGVLTNNPPFDYHLYNLSNYLNLTNRQPENNFAPGIQIIPYSRGMGAIGLPGDLSSASRFIKAAFTKINANTTPDELTSVTQFFHILGAVEQQEGCVVVNDQFEKTVYSSCCNMQKGIYYYKTYETSQIHAVKMHNVDLDSKNLIAYPMKHEQQIFYQN